MTSLPATPMQTLMNSTSSFLSLQNSSKSLCSFAFSLMHFTRFWDGASLAIVGDVTPSSKTRKAYSIGIRDEKINLTLCYSGWCTFRWIGRIHIDVANYTPYASLNCNLLWNLSCSNYIHIAFHPRFFTVLAFCGKYLMFLCVPVDLSSGSCNEEAR